MCNIINLLNYKVLINIEFYNIIMKNGENINIIFLNRYFDIIMKVVYS